MSASVAITRLVASPQRRELVLSAVGAAAVCCTFAILLLPTATVDSLVAEDGVVEWAGALGLFAAAGLFFASFLAVRRREDSASQFSPAGSWILLGIAALLLVAGGEEISWGQRLLGLSTPDSLSRVNVQAETNLHNIEGIEGKGDRVFRLVWLGLFVAVPLAARSARARARLRSLVPIVPLGLTALFVLAWGIAEIAPNVFAEVYDGTGPLNRGVIEVWEAVAEVLIAVAALVTLRQVLGRTSSRRLDTGEPR